MRTLSSLVLAATVAASAQVAASPPVMEVNPAAESDLIVETKVLSVETRAPAKAEGIETTEIRCTVTKITKSKKLAKIDIRVGSKLSVVGTCERMAKPLEMQAVGYPSDRCDAGAWTAPYWMKEQKKDQALTLHLKQAIDESTKKPIAGTLETVADRRPASRPALVTVAPAGAAKK